MQLYVRATEDKWTHSPSSCAYPTQTFERAESSPELSHILPNIISFYEYSAPCRNVIQCLGGLFCEDDYIIIFCTYCRIKHKSWSGFNNSISNLKDVDPSALQLHRATVPHHLSVFHRFIFDPITAFFSTVQADRRLVRVCVPEVNRGHLYNCLDAVWISQDLASMPVLSTSACEKTEKRERDLKKKKKHPTVCCVVTDCLHSAFKNSGNESRDGERRL